MKPDVVLKSSKDLTFTQELDNNVLIPSGEARLVGWSRSMLYSGFNTLPRSVVRLADSSVRWDNTDVTRLHEPKLEKCKSTLTMKIWRGK